MRPGPIMQAGRCGGDRVRSWCGHHLCLWRIGVWTKRERCLKGIMDDAALSGRKAGHFLTPAAALLVSVDTRIQIQESSVPACRRCGAACASSNGLPLSFFRKSPVHKNLMYQYRDTSTDLTVVCVCVCGGDVEWCWILPAQLPLCSCSPAASGACRSVLVALQRCDLRVNWQGGARQPARLAITPSVW